MLIRNILLAAPALALVLTGCAVTETLEERENAFLTMTEPDFTAGVSVVDDPLNPSIEINTRGSYQDFQFVWGPQEDQFLRGYKFRETGHVALQGYVTSDINGTWLHPVSVTFRHTLSARPVDRISFDANRCSSYGCMHREDMVFEFTPEELDQVIADMEAKDETAFAFRIQGQSGVDRDGRFHLNELKAFRIAVRETFSPD
mgnify:CR=1 FL=1